ncbi:MAG: hypothetical protein JF606_06050 [Burkholderiales bacterium]|nr:hypothetical protein [Burkholderiales bacterium]
MKSNGADPLSVASNLRASAQRWFGNSGFVRRVRDALAPLAKANPDDEVIGNKVRQLDDRIEVLRVIDGHLEARASDSLKRHEFPKAQHLNQLLKLNQIAGLSAPVRLPSAGDQGERGTLFELTITPRPFSDGNEAPAVYLHLHTLRQVSPHNASRFALTTSPPLTSRAKSKGVWVRAGRNSSSYGATPTPVCIEALWTRNCWACCCSGQRVRCNDDKPPLALSRLILANSAASSGAFCRAARTRSRCDGHFDKLTAPRGKRSQYKTLKG